MNANACDESLTTAPEPTRTRAPVAPAATELPPPHEPEGRTMDGWLLRRLRTLLGDPPLELALCGGARVGPDGTAPVARVTFANRANLMSILADPWVRFGDAYSEGSVDRGRRPGEPSRDGLPRQRHGRQARDAAAARRWHACVARTATRCAGSRDNIHHHYDIGNEFYSLWLGQHHGVHLRLLPDAAATTLDEAQDAKMDHVCRKLRLRPGERVVEAGCGWGALALHMARHYGVQVRAFNISREQVAYARDARKRARGSESQIEYVEDDYRNISGRLRRLRLGRHARARRRRELPRRSGKRRARRAWAATAAA